MCFYIFPSQVATGTGPPVLDVRFNDVVCVCRGNPSPFFFNEPQTLCTFARARTFPRPARKTHGLSGGRMAPTRCPLHSARVVMLYCMLIMLLLIFCHHCASFPLPRAHDIHFFVRYFISRLCLYFPLSGGNRDGTTGAKREI